MFSRGFGNRSRRSARTLDLLRYLPRLPAPLTPCQMPVPPPPFLLFRVTTQPRYVIHVFETVRDLRMGQDRRSNLLEVSRQRTRRDALRPDDGMHAVPLRRRTLPERMSPLRAVAAEVLVPCPGGNLRRVSVPRLFPRRFRRLSLVGTELDPQIGHRLRSSGNSADVAYLKKITELQLQGTPYNYPVRPTAVPAPGTCKAYKRSATS